MLSPDNAIRFVNNARVVYLITFDRTKYLFFSVFLFFLVKTVSTIRMILKNSIFIFLCEYIDYNSNMCDLVNKWLFNKFSMISTLNVV